MGRHSAPGGDEAEPPSAELTTDTLIASGRHTRPVEAVQATAVAPRRPVEPPAGTRGDLHLLRASHALRMRCAAAVLVPFVLYTVLLVTIGRTDVYLIWLWIPTVLAGVSVGSFLDVAHRKLRTSAAERVAAPDGSVPDGSVPDGSMHDD